MANKTENESFDIVGGGEAPLAVAGRQELPALPLRGMSVFPGMMLSFDVERPMSIAALNAAMKGDRLVFLVAQRDLADEEPAPEGLYKVGTVCRVRQVLRVPGGEGGAKVLAQGLRRACLSEVTAQRPCYRVLVDPLSDEPEFQGATRAEALIRQCAGLFAEYAELTGASAAEVLLTITGHDDPGYVADYVAQNIYMKHTSKQLVLEELHPQRRLALVNRMIRQELDIARIEQNINENAQRELSRSQKEYFLREQIRAIQAELGEGGEEDESGEYARRVQALKFPPETEKKLLKEVARMSRQPYGSSEAAVTRNYLDTVLELPWHEKSQETLDVARAKKLLDADHYGLESVKNRILEYLAVRQLSPEIKGDILCLVGPPGTGKTSVALSVARAMNRKLTSISLGGVHDESEIRGHRKTYVGAMPGRIITGVQQAGVSNPVMVLDEIDKLGSDYRGDPSAALLEALDPEQNKSFRDHFVEIPFDLSEVFFITTANTTHTIPRPLLDRMEVIEISGYTDEEKLHIAKAHLMPKQRKKHGLNGNQIRVSDGAIREIITLYTKEAGVRLLERELASVCRKAARGIAEGEYRSLSVRAGQLEKLLGVPKYKPAPLHPADEVGLVRGLAWTSVGGEVLDVEAAVCDGSGRLELTGNLGDVMKESVKAAVTYIRGRAPALGIDPDFYKNKDIHIHFPEGAVPKDGPSAGITVCICLISALTGRPVRRDLAMTGEITLRGRILPIGGLKEKTMAALRTGIHTVIIPADNEKDLADIDQDVRRALDFVTADTLDSVVDVALRPAPEVDNA